MWGKECTGLSQAPKSCAVLSLGRGPKRKTPNGVDCFYGHSKGTKQTPNSEGLRAWGAGKQGGSSVLWQGLHAGLNVPLAGPDFQPPKTLEGRERLYWPIQTVPIFQSANLQWRPCALPVLSPAQATGCVFVCVHACTCAHRPRDPAEVSSPCSPEAFCSGCPRLNREWGSSECGGGGGRALGS